MKDSPPIAVRKEKRITHHGISVTDPYAWLRDPNYPKVEDPQILNYLEAENAWFDAQMAPLTPLIDQLFGELKARQPEDDASVPYRQNGWMYQWRFAKGTQYRTWWRWPVSDQDSPAERDVKTGTEIDAINAPPDAECFLNEPELSQGHEFFRLGSLSVSPDGRYLAYSVDTNGSERYRLRLQDLTGSKTLAEEIDNTGSGVTWAQDNETLFYTLLSDQWRPYVAKRHKIGTDPKTDVEVYVEQDDSFFVGVSTSQSDEWILISTGDHVTSEIRVIPSDQPSSKPLLIEPRKLGREYDLDHAGEHFYLLTNDTHKNFRLVRAPVDTPTQEHWENVIEGHNDHYLTDFVCFKNLLVVEERIKGLDQIRLIDLTKTGDAASHYIEFPEATYSAFVGSNVESKCSQLRIGYNSMVTPTTVWDYDLSTSTLITRKIQQIPTEYNSADYTCERRLIKARDGVEVPVSLVCRKDTAINADTPLYLYGYGAYGSAIPPGFSTSRLSLLDRGFVFAIAHIRGGDDLGYHWYEAGKLKERTNTFNDFVDVAQGLIREGLSSAGRIAIAGGSAGGELMGAVVNQAPQLWGAVASHVPFVDVLNTMLDAELPLTPMEWPEWGNPILDKEAFEHILSYSPYDQLKEGEYPPMLVTAGLNDPRVTYWEPAKYVAKLRSLKKDSNRLLLKTNMGAGHSGKSGRFDSLRETAEEYAFILRELEIGEK